MCWTIFIVPVQGGFALAPECPQPALLRKACSAFRASLAHLQGASGPTLPTADEDRFDSVRARASWQLAVAAAHASDWFSVKVAVDELMDCASNGQPEAVSRRLDALRLKGQALLQLKQAQEALTCLSDPLLKGDAKSQKLLATARSRVKSQTAKDKKTWGKALQSMSAEGTMSAGRGRPARELEAEALQSVLGERRNMSTQQRPAAASVRPQTLATRQQKKSELQALAAELGVPEAGMLPPGGDAAPSYAPSPDSDTGDDVASSPLGYLAAAAVIAGLVIGGIAITRAWQSSK